MSRNHCLYGKASGLGLKTAIRSGLWRVFSLLPARAERGWSCGEASAQERPFVN